MTEYNKMYQECVEQRQNGQLMSISVPHQLKSRLLEQLMYSQVCNKIISDFVALTLIVGNDFVPEVPGQSIKNSALDKLMGFYKNNNLDSIPFVNLLDDNYTISTKFFGKIFTILGKECEPIQIIDDYKNLIKIHNIFQNDFKQSILDATGDWRALVMREYDDMMEEVGSVIGEISEKARMDKIPYETRKTLTDYYRKMYYLKF